MFGKLLFDLDLVAWQTQTTDNCNQASFLNRKRIKSQYGERRGLTFV